jgi:hypothetical protein
MYSHSTSARPRDELYMTNTISEDLSGKDASQEQPVPASLGGRAPPLLTARFIFRIPSQSKNITTTRITHSNSRTSPDETSWLRPRAAHTKDHSSLIFLPLISGRRWPTTKTCQAPFRRVLLLINILKPRCMIPMPLPLLQGNGFRVHRLWTHTI